MNFFIKAYFATVLLLMPVQRMELPLSIALLDVVNVVASPFLLSYLLLRRSSFRVPYASAVWCILIGSLIATAQAADPIASLEVVVKDVYLYVWFLTLVSLFTLLPIGSLRLLLVAWVSVTILHGLFILLQFVSPEIRELTTAYVGKYQATGSLRPLG